MEAISARGFALWYDKGITVSSAWTDEIANAILGCGIFVIFITKNAMGSRYVRAEAEFALNKGRTVIPVYLENMDVLPSGLALGLTAIQGIDDSDAGAIVEQLCNALQYNGILRDANTESSGTVKLKNYKSKRNSTAKRIFAALLLLFIAAGGAVSAHFLLGDGGAQDTDPAVSESTAPVGNNGEAVTERLYSAEPTFGVDADMNTAIVTSAPSATPAAPSPSVPSATPTVPLTPSAPLATPAAPSPSVPSATPATVLAPSATPAATPAQSAQDKREAEQAEREAKLQAEQAAREAEQAEREAKLRAEQAAREAEQKALQDAREAGYNGG
jgi:hypothetical protein